MLQQSRQLFGKARGTGAAPASGRLGGAAQPLCWRAISMYSTASGPCLKCASSSSAPPQRVSACGDSDPSGGAVGLVCTSRRRAASRPRRRALLRHQERSSPQVGSLLSAITCASRGFCFHSSSACSLADSKKTSLSSSSLGNASISVLIQRLIPGEIPFNHFLHTDRPSGDAGKMAVRRRTGLERESGSRCPCPGQKGADTRAATQQ